MGALVYVGFTSASGLGVRVHGANRARLDPEGAGPLGATFGAKRHPEVSRTSGGILSVSLEWGSSVSSAVAGGDRLCLLVVHDVMLVCLLELETGGPVSSSQR